MKTSNILFAAAAAVFAAGAFAQPEAGPAPGIPQASVADEWTDGEIRKIDKETGKVTLKHGEIRKLGMPPMAMVFETKDPKVLDGLKVGDKVRFRANHESGKYVLRDIEPAK
jgi:Cu/Ag efflux protein CusF